MPDITLEGGCLCGHVCYRASGSPHTVTHSHCEQCRRFTGAIYATGLAYKVGNIKWMHGEPTMYLADETSVRGRSFCPKCGSSIVDHQLADSDIWLYVGTLDKPGSVAPQNHIFTEEKISWVEIGDGLPQSTKDI